MTPTKTMQGWIDDAEDRTIGSIIALTMLVGLLLTASIAIAATDDTDKYVDRFEKYNVTYTIEDAYSGDTGRFMVDAKAAYDGDKGLWGDGGGTSSRILIDNQTFQTPPRPGDDIIFYMFARHEYSDGKFIFAVQNSTHYYSVATGATGSLSLYRHYDGGADLIAQANKDLGEENWKRINVSWAKNGDFTISMISPDTGLVYASGIGHDDNYTDGGFGFVVGDDYDVYFDEVLINGSVATSFRISGKVKDVDGHAIANATVSAGGQSDTTNSNGNYEIFLQEGNYEISASKSGYWTSSKNISVDGPQTVDFTLRNESRSLCLKVKHHMQHGEESQYRVIAEYPQNGSFVKENVTADAILTSANTSVVEVNESRLTLRATEDVTVNNKTYISAAWTEPGGTTLSTLENVTVANNSLENIEILPPISRFGAALSDKSVIVIFLATAVGAAVSIVATSFAGVAGIFGIMLLGWIMGIIGNGMIIVAFLSCTMVGLNLAGNIDYQVSR